MSTHDEFGSPGVSFCPFRELPSIFRVPPPVWFLFSVALATSKRRIEIEIRESVFIMSLAKFSPAHAEYFQQIFDLDPCSES